MAIDISHNDIFTLVYAQIIMFIIINCGFEKIKVPFLIC